MRTIEIDDRNIRDKTDPKELVWWRQPDEASFWTAQLVNESTVVTSSLGWPRDGNGAIYTFPNRRGDQEDPPLLTETETSE